MEELLYSSNNTLIILLPPTSTALINRNNAQQFFESGNYQEYHSGNTNFSTTRFSYYDFYGINIQGFKCDKNIGGINISILFTEASYTQYFKEEHWRRVVGIIVQGGEWQFQGFPFENITLLFSLIR